MKQVRETTAARSIRAIVIMRGKRHVATVQAHYGNSRVSVDVWHTDGTPLQQGSASGYGYDKFTAALSGLTIDGHKMTDHCGARKTRHAAQRFGRAMRKSHADIGSPITAQRSTDIQIAIASRV